MLSLFSLSNQPCSIFAMRFKSCKNYDEKAYVIEFDLLRSHSLPSLSNKFHRFSPSFSEIIFLYITLLSSALLV